MSTCPDHEALTGLIENRLDAGTRAVVEDHVAGCAVCLDVVAASTRVIGRRDAPAVPGGAVPRRAPRPMRWARIAAAAVLVVSLTGGIGYLAAAAVADYARSSIERVAAAAIGAPVTLDSVALTVVPDLRALGLRVIGVDLGAPGSIGAIEIVAATAALRNGRFQAARIRFYRPDLAWTIPARPGATTAPVGADLLAALALAPSIEIIDGSLTLDGTTRLTEITGGATSAGRRVDLALAGRFADRSVSLRGTIEFVEPPRLDLMVTGDPGAAPLPGARAAGVEIPFRLEGTVDAPRYRPAD